MHGLGYRLKQLGKRGDLIPRVRRHLSALIMERIRRWIVHLNIKHISGPEFVDYDIDELVVVCLVRNARLYIRPFIEHYRSLGVRHIFFLDNDSIDNTVALAQDYKNITIFRSSLPFKWYKSAMRQYLISRFGKGRWCLCVDIDEFFDYPYSNMIPLAAFLRYLNVHSYTVLVAQMLDMFTEAPWGSWQSAEGDSLKDLYQFYDISDITRMDYYAKNIVSNPAIKVHFGGIHQTVFGIAHVKLTKHPLVFSNGRVKPVYDGSHEARHGHAADITCVLFHYKFLSNFPEYTLQIVQEESYYNRSTIYKTYHEAWQQNPNLSIKRHTARRLESTNELVANEFLVVSEAYENWVEQHNQ